MPGQYEIELEPEVRAWLDSLPLEQYAKAEAMADLLGDRAQTLGEPYARHLGGKTRELRFNLHRGDVRVSYWLAPGRRVVLLTVFTKTRQHERAEVSRALAAQRACERGHASGQAGHTPAMDIYERKWD
ncbi:MAG: type II toxin-antitoxin system RelE/ParE family toxin [Streptosporangiaceae bacterium]